MATKYAKDSFSYERFSIVIIWVGFIIIGGAIVFFFLDSFWFNLLNQEQTAFFGTFGEYIGGLVGSIWTLAGVVLFYEALRFQRDELKMQRQELEFQRGELMEQTEQLRVQNDNLSFQNDDNRFFQMISFHNEIVQSITVTVVDFSKRELSASNKQISGRESFVEFYIIYKRYYLSQFDDLKTHDLSQEIKLQIIKNSYWLFYLEHQSILGHYFRNLTIILEFASSIKKPTENEFYINMIKAQLSNDELLLLFFHTLSDQGKRFKLVIENFCLFENLPEDELVMMNKDLYEEKAYFSGKLNS